MKYLLFCFLFCSCESPLLSHGDTPASDVERIVKGQWLSKQEISINFKWQEGPHGNPAQASVLNIEVRDEAGEFTDFAEDVDVIHYAYMPSMGHGPADEGFLVREDTGRYQLQELFFSMGGAWTLTFEFQKTGKIIEKLVLDLNL